MGAEGVAWTGSLVITARRQSEDAGSGEEGCLAMGCPYLVTEGKGVYSLEILSVFS